MTTRKPYVLLLEEDARLAEAYGRRLEMRHCRVKIVRTVAEAKRRMRPAVPDVLVLDAATQDGQGMALIQWLRSHPTTLTLPILVLAARTDRSLIREARVAGVTAYLMKTQVSPRVLAERVVHSLVEKGRTA
ncbi:response regulator [Candidatus Uhrbacteria bacterium]|nr:response regulator [Candidatus Uhrbacteria bacterium]